MPTPEELAVPTLGPCKVRSPLNLSTVAGDGRGNFIPDDRRVLLDIELTEGQTPESSAAFERAGARERLFFEPSQTRAAIITTGGLCPGLNNVIRSVFFELNSNYGVPDVLGIRFGFRGLNPEAGLPPVRLTGQMVEEIHKHGGSILGSSRGHQEPAVMAQFLVDQGINVLLCCGGDGTMRGAHSLAEEIRRRNLQIAVVGIPKTIDNDIAYVYRSFGFSTALERSQEHITGAHNEARGAVNGIGLVKLMGRHAGFIAAGATLASGEVNFTLIPEVPFKLEGEDGLLAKLRRRILARHHAVIVVAEGAGQELIADVPERYDASGNKQFGDIGEFLQQQIKDYFDREGVEVSIKYFDPSYHIRSLPANLDDSLLCDQLARRAVHAAMAGKTDMLVGLWNNYYIHVPLPLVAHAKRRLSPEDDIWVEVLAVTGQERW